MQILSKGRIINTSSEDKTFNYHSPKDFEIELCSDEDGKTGGYYIFFRNENLKEYFDNWFENKAMALEYIQNKEALGWVIQWE
ncbi:TPA: hypothetical protein DEP96_02960 [Candidatus Uhrbacteria bacterium]|nr:hypothetical protein [Candidatus Uhrbacteria bacterium]